MLDASLLSQFKDALAAKGDRFVAVHGIRHSVFPPVGAETNYLGDVLLPASPDSAEQSSHALIIVTFPWGECDDDQRSQDVRESLLRLMYRAGACLPDELQERLRFRSPATEIGNDSAANDLRQSEKSPEATGECAAFAACQAASDDDAECPAPLCLIAQAWPLLPPHIREAILTLVDVSLLQSEQEGAEP